jgi:hypothetical protein
MTLVTDLDSWASTLATAVSLPATRDPDLVLPPCILVGLPEITAVTLTAVTCTVPVWLVAAGTGKPAGDQLLTSILTLLNQPDMVHAASDTTITVAGVDFHAYACTARLQITL